MTGTVAAAPYVAAVTPVLVMLKVVALNPSPPHLERTSLCVLTPFGVVFMFGRASDPVWPRLPGPDQACARVFAESTVAGMLGLGIPYVC